MKKVAIIYWSEYGKVELLANSIAIGAEKAGAEVILKRVQEARVEDVVSADAVAFGSLSMDNNNVEQLEMAPFLKEFKLLPNGNKPAVLFGSYGCVYYIDIGPKLIQNVTVYDNHYVICFKSGIEIKI